MAPVRKTKGVNKRFPYINEVASSKYGDNANKNKQKKRKLSDMLGPQWTTEELKHFYEGYRKYGRDWKKVASVVRHRSVENVEALYTMNRAYLSLPEGTASVIGLTAMMCDYYSMLERSDSEQESIDDAGTSRKPRKLARGKLRNDASKGLEGHIPDISQSRSIASDGCLSLLKNRRTGIRPHAVKKRTPRVPVSSYDKDNSKKYFSPARQGVKTSTDGSDVNMAQELAFSLTEPSHRGSSPQVSRTPKSKAKGSSPSPVQNGERMFAETDMKIGRPRGGEMDGVGCELSLGSMQADYDMDRYYLKRQKREESENNHLKDVKESSSGTEEEQYKISTVKGKLGARVVGAKNASSFHKDRKKTKTANVGRDEDSSFDALLTLADLSLRMPEATAEMKSYAPVEEENFNIAKNSKLRGNPSFTLVEDTALKTSQLGKLKEGVPQSTTGIQKRKQKSPVKLQINENEAQTEFPWSDNQMIEILESGFDSRILRLQIRRNKMARPKFKFISSSSEESREDTQSQESLDEETSTSFHKTLQHEMTKIKQRKKKQAEDTDDEDTAEEETEDEDEDETRSRYCVKSRSQKRKTTEDVDEEYDEKGKKKRKVQLPKTKEQKAKKDGRKKNEEKEETEKKEENIDKIDCRQQKCTLSAFWRLIDAHKSRIPAATWEILRHTVFWGMIEPFLEQKLTENQLHKHEADLEIIMRYFDKKKNKFIFGEKEMEITAQDVKALFDLPTEGIYMELNKKLSKEERKESVIFDTNVKKESVLKTEVEKKLVKELTKEKKEKDKKQQDPKKIASLIIMYLFAAFFFSRTATNITWDLISVCEDIDNINKFNWSRMIIDFLLDGIQKYQKDKPTTLSGCLLLIYYWFLEKTKIKNWIPGKETETPRFVRWSIKEIFNLQEVYKNPGWPERLIKDGPWLEKEWLEELDFEEKIEEEETPSFNNWVPQAGQREEEEMIRLMGNMRVIIEELETVLGKEPTRENMEEKLKRLAEGNEQLSKQSKEMLTKLKIADEMIESLEKKRHDMLLETRANKNQIAALYKLLAKAKHSGNADDAGASQEKESQLQILQISIEEEQVRQAEFKDNRA